MRALSNPTAPPAATPDSPSTIPTYKPSDQRENPDFDPNYVIEI